MSILQALQDAERVRPIARKNGLDIVTFEDQRVLAQKAILENQDLGNRTVNEKGFPTRSLTPTAAVNPEHLFINRYRVVGDTIQVVTDYRAIKEQDTGRVYLKVIPAYTIERDKNKKLVLGKTVMISDAEFIGEFTNTLDNESMRLVLPLIAKGNTSAAGKLPI